VAEVVHLPALRPPAPIDQPMCRTVLAPDPDMSVMMRADVFSAPPTTGTPVDTARMAGRNQSGTDRPSIEDLMDQGIAESRGWLSRPSPHQRRGDTTHGEQRTDNGKYAHARITNVAFG
jgi:hypothetical protein